MWYVIIFKFVNQKPIAHIIYTLYHFVYLTYCTVYDFINQRQCDARNMSRNYSDKTTLILYGSNASAICRRLVVSNPQQFVQQYCFTSSFESSTHFGKALYAASREIKNNENTCVVFLTDGEDMYEGAIVNGKTATQWAREMVRNANKVKMFVVQIGGNRAHRTLTSIAQVTNTKVQRAPDARSLGQFFIKVVARQAARFSLVTTKAQSNV